MRFRLSELCWLCERHLAPSGPRSAKSTPQVSPRRALTNQAIVDWLSLRGCFAALSQSSLESLAKIVATAKVQRENSRTSVSDPNDIALAAVDRRRHPSVRFGPRKRGRLPFVSAHRTDRAPHEDKDVKAGAGSNVADSAWPNKWRIARGDYTFTHPSKVAYSAYLLTPPRTNVADSR